MFKSRLFLRLIIALAFSGVFAAIQYRKCAKGWAYKGCNVGYHHNFTKLEDDRYPSAKVKIDWDNMDGYLHDLLCRCREVVAGKYQYMLINKEGMCFGGPGSFAEYLRTHRLETDPTRCGGKLVVTGPQLSDGSQCIPGIFRGFLYTVEKPAASAEEKTEEEVASNQGGEKEAVASCTEVADVVLVLDISGSVNEAAFKIQKHFTSEFIRRFDLSKSRVAIITYDQDIQSSLTWKKSSEMKLQGLLQYVQNLKYTGGYTFTAKALNYVISNIIIPDKRPNVHITCIVMTDGKAHDRAKLNEPASKLRNELKVKMLAIGVGSYDKEELKVVVGKNNEDNINTYENFQQLGANLGVELNKLVNKTCI